MVRMCIAGLVSLSVAMLAAPAAIAVESLPMPVARYGELCELSGGAIALQLTGGVGIAQCQWPDHGRTECKVGGNLVTVCGITCQSNACLKANPARYTPVWPLGGGPNGAAPAN
jgi:hypothetical protein